MPSLDGGERHLLSGSPRSTEGPHPCRAARVSAETSVPHDVRAGAGDIEWRACLLEPTRHQPCRAGLVLDHEDPHELTP
jgi:hypothetical protein